MTRHIGDILAFPPPLIVDDAHSGEIFSTVAQMLKEGSGVTV